MKIPTKLVKASKDNFFRGWLACGACISLTMDIVGQEHTADAAHWITGWVTVPLALAGLAFVAMTIEKKQSK